MTLRVQSVAPPATLQDGGRPGFRDRGVPPGGPLDLGALRLANVLVGNAAEAAALEFGPGRLELVAETATWVAWDGAAFQIRLNGQVTPLRRVFLQAGDTLTVQAQASGAAWYLAMPGGIVARPVLGSVSGHPVCAGDALTAALKLDAGALGDSVLDSFWPAPQRLRVLPGPAASRLDVRALTDHPWRVRPESDRRGLRLEGEPMADVYEARSEPAVRGAVQVTPDGGAILLGPDGPTVGGYPVLAVVVRADLDRAGQLRPGDRVGFRAVSPDEARAAWARHLQSRSTLEQKVRAE